MNKLNIYIHMQDVLSMQEPIIYARRIIYARTHKVLNHSPHKLLKKHEW